MRLLVIDDDPSLRVSLEHALTGLGELELVSSGEEALQRLDRFKPDLLLCDVRLNGMSGLDVLRIVRARARHVDTILMTAYDDMPTIVAAMRDGAFDFLIKPLDLHDLRRVVQRAAHDRRTRRTEQRPIEDSTDPLIGFVGRAPGIIEVFKLIGQAAATPTTVLIRGETGTGKELVARAIHFHSGKAHEPFVAVNCTAIPAALLESELFGHIKGSFTGAISNRAGRFALAGSGTVLLDEIGDTTGDFQTKLLRVLEERQYYPVGAEKPQATQARVVTATHRPLEELISLGAFRSDLYYRLRVIEIVLPPLRERTGDIPQLAAHFIRRACSKLQRIDVPSVSPKAMEILVTRLWPGNVRELENCILRAVVLATGNVIRPEHVAEKPGLGAPVAAKLTSLSEVEKDHVRRVLEAMQGHKAQTAAVLGVSRPRLDRLIDKYGL